jgi:hypothetical protein
MQNKACAVSVTKGQAFVNAADWRGIRFELGQADETRSLSLLSLLKRGFTL